jgi:hypothetical protein
MKPQKPMRVSEIQSSHPWEERDEMREPDEKSSRERQRNEELELLNQTLKSLRPS